MSKIERIPMFPLGLILLPGMSLPLHIFEERYRALTKYCLDNNEVFGIVYYNGSTLRKSGCTARIESVLEKYEDGRSDILTIGEDRFQIKDLHQEKLFIEADVQFFHDEDDKEDLEYLIDDSVKYLNKLANLTHKKIQSDQLRDLSPSEVSFLLAASDIFSLEERQEALETTCIQHRLEMFITNAKRNIDRINSTQQIQKILGNKDDISHLFN
jgi:Lon protease-like protein